MIRAFALLIAGVLLLPAMVGAQARTPGVPATAEKTNFSGRWKMVKDKSNFGSFHAPDIVIRVIDQHDPTFNLHTVQTTGTKTTVADVSYFTDGSEAKNVINGRDANSKAYWDGAALVVRTEMKDSKSEDIVIEDRYELADEGKTLVNSSHIVTPNGSVDMKLVCEKQATS